jgi:hypothetical protein
MTGGQERRREKLNQLKEQKMKSLKFNWIKLHYLFVALLFASFAVAQSVQAENHPNRLVDSQSASYLTIIL